MAVRLNKQAFEHAKNLVEQGKFVFDEKDMWSEHQPSARDENEYLQKHREDMKNTSSWLYHLHIIRIPAPEARVIGQHTHLCMPIINIHKTHKSYMSI